MRLAFHRHAWQDYLSWWLTDKATLRQVNQVIEAACLGGQTGMGKPQALKAPLDGYFSRRINADHRLVYRFDAGVVTIAQCRTSLFELPKKVHSIDLSAEEIQYEMGMVSTMIKDGGDVA